MSQLKLYVFGPPRLEQRGQALEVRPRKALALLVYLAVTRQPHSRDSLATLFWPDYDQTAARASLRRTIHRLHESLGQEALAASLDTASLHPRCEFWLDSERYQQIVGECLPARHPIADLDENCLARLIEAAEICTGDFLAGFNLPDSPEFDTWQFFQREGLRQSLAHVLEQIAAVYQARQEHEQAIPFARRWLALDPLHEPVHRQLMRLYAWAGQQAAALRQYQECERILAEELDVPPEAETQQLYIAIKNKQVAAPSAQTSGSAAGEAPAHAASRPQRSELARTRNNLPAQSTPFVGREHELSSIVRHLRDPNCRLLVLVGPGGIGKTRLAIQAAQSLADAHYDHSRFADGILFVGLAAVSAPGGVAPAIATALGLDLQGNVLPSQQLLIHLRDKRMLLVLDNIEHLLTATDLVADILALAADVKILATSREGLNLQASWLYPIAGMSHPAHDAQPTVPADAYEAVQLFVQSARRVRPDFSLGDDAPHIVRICRLVEGMPLAIELAATWLKLLSAEMIAAEIERGLDFLVNMHRDAPARHRNMRAVLEYSWQLLSEEERAVLARLSVFLGGFHREAAGQVANTSLLTLALLVDKSLVQVETAGRYQLHNLLRQFAAEKLHESPTEEQATRDRHVAYYLDFVSIREGRLTRKEMPTVFAEVAVEIDNIALAWRWALAQEHLEVIERACVTLWRFYAVRGHSQVLAQILSQAVTHLQQSPAAQRHPRYEATLRVLLAQEAECEFQLSNFAAAAARFSESLVLARKLGQTQQIASALCAMGAIAGRQGRQEQAENYLLQSLAHFKETGYLDGVADALHELSHVYGYRGEYQEARRLALESLAICRQLERLDWIAYALDALGWITFALGAYSDARCYYEESLDYFRRFDHQLGIALAIGGFGIVAWAENQERLREAVSLLEESLAICRRIGHRLHTASRLVHLAQAANDTGDYGQARRYGEEGLSIATEIGAADFRVYLDCCLAESAYGVGDWEASRVHLTQALALADKHRLRPRLALVLYHWAILLLKESDDIGVPEAVTAQARRQAAELLDLSARHPANWHVFRQRAQEALSRLHAQATSDILTALEAQIDTRTLEEVVMELLV